MELLSMRNDCKFEKCFPFYFMLNFATLHKSLGPCHFLLRFVISYSTDNLSERPGLGGSNRVDMALIFVYHCHYCFFKGMGVRGCGSNGHLLSTVLHQ